jgi:hypothetical protein
MSHDSNVDAHQLPPSAGSKRPFSHTLSIGVRLLGPSLLVGLVAPALFPALRKAVRPAAKGFMKGALSLSESVKEGAVTAREQLTDLLTEVRAEREQESTAVSDPQDRT